MAADDLTTEGQLSALSAAVKADVDGKASTTHAATHATGGTDPLDLGTQLSIDGTPVDTYDLDTTPLTAADVGAYTTLEVDDLISGVGGDTTEPVQGTSLFDAGNAETVARTPGYVDKNLGSGTLWLQFFYAPRTTLALTRLGYSVRATAPSGVTLARLAVFTVASNGDLTKSAQTASFTPTGAYADQIFPLSTAGGYPATVTLARGARYAFGVLVVASNAGNGHGFDIPGAGQNPAMSRRVTGQTDIAASYTSASQSDWYETIRLFALHAAG